MYFETGKHRLEILKISKISRYMDRQSSKLESPISNHNIQNPKKQNPTAG